MEETGFDLEAVVSGEDVPDYLNGEIIWQSWADAHGGGFDASWTRSGVAQALAQVGGRVPFIAHVELSQFGDVKPTAQQLAASLRYAAKGGALHLDFYGLVPRRRGQRLGPGPRRLSRGRRPAPAGRPSRFGPHPAPLNDPRGCGTAPER